MIGVFMANYYDGHYSITRAVTANTQNEALGLLLESYPDKITKGWSMEELDLTKTGVKEITYEI